MSDEGVQSAIDKVESRPKDIVNKEFPSDLIYKPYKETFIYTGAKGYALIQETIQKEVERLSKLPSDLLVKELPKVPTDNWINKQYWDWANDQYIPNKQYKTILNQNGSFCSDKFTPEMYFGTDPYINKEEINMDTQIKDLTEELIIDWSNVTYGLCKHKSYTVIIQDIDKKYLLTLAEAYKNYNDYAYVKDIAVNKNKLQSELKKFIPKEESFSDFIVETFGERFNRFYIEECKPRANPNTTFKSMGYTYFDSREKASYVINNNVTWSNTKHNEFLNELYYKIDISNFNKNKDKIKEFIDKYLDEIQFK